MRKRALRRERKAQLRQVYRVNGIRPSIARRWAREQARREEAASA